MGFPLLVIGVLVFLVAFHVLLYSSFGPNVSPKIVLYKDVTEEVLKKIEARKVADLPLQEVPQGRNFSGTRISQTGHEDIVKPITPCAGTSSAFLLILVGSPVKNYHRRRVVRSTWGAITSHKGYTIKTVFYMGKALNSILQGQVVLENKEYNDIYQSQIDDGYYNLTLKNLDGFKWALTECPVARYVLKVDDDVFVYPRNTVDYLTSMRVKDEATLYQGYGMSANPAYRNKKNKWYISYETYRNATYPPYNLGFAVLFSMKIVKDIHDASFKAPSYYKVDRNFPFEDVFMGICAKYLGIVPKFVYDRFYRNPGPFYKAVAANKCRYLTAIAAHEVDLGLFYYYLKSSDNVRISIIKACPKLA
jgi:hypothetical protein